MQPLKTACSVSGTGLKLVKKSSARIQLRSSCKPAPAQVGLMFPEPSDMKHALVVLYESRTRGSKAGQGGSKQGRGGQNHKGNSRTGQGRRVQAQGHSKGITGMGRTAEARAGHNRAE